MNEANIIDFPTPKWITELISIYSKSEQTATAEMIFDLYYKMRERPDKFTAEKIYEVITSTYTLKNETSKKRILGNTAIIYLPECSH